MRYIPAPQIRYDTNFTDEILSVQDNPSNLEKILWSEVGTKTDYEAEYGEKPLGEFVREMVGNANAKAAGRVFQTNYRKQAYNGHNVKNMVR